MLLKAFYCSSHRWHNLLGQCLFVGFRHWMLSELMFFGGSAIEKSNWMSLLICAPGKPLLLSGSAAEYLDNFSWVDSNTRVLVEPLLLGCFT